MSPPVRLLKAVRLLDTLEYAHDKTAVDLFTFFTFLLVVYSRRRSIHEGGLFS